MILEDCMPQELEKIKDPFWINPAAVSLSVNLWERDGLFAPKEPPRDFSEIDRQIRSLYTFHKDGDSERPHSTRKLFTGLSP
jgi:hypothetical protein